MLDAMTHLAQLAAAAWFWLALAIGSAACAAGFIWGSRWGAKRAERIVTAGLPLALRQTALESGYCSVCGSYSKAPAAAGAAERFSPEFRDETALI